MPGTEAERRAELRRLESEPALVARLREEILAAPEGRITFARFMARALTEPGLGYYATSARRPTREGDFLTAPELHPLFGRCLGRFLDACWRRLGSPSSLVVREYGAGRGRLRDTVVAGLEADVRDAAAGEGPAAPGGEGPRLAADRIAWQAVDLPSTEPPAGEEAGAATGGLGLTGVVLANEFLDALPVHRLIVEDGALREAYVGWREGWFAEVVGPLSDEDLAAPLRTSDVSLVEGQRVEVRPAVGSWLREVAADLRAGVILVIDYGHPAAELYDVRRSAGSLVTYRDHVAGDDPFEAVGRQDLTAHVDISALEREADSLALARIGSTTQARFLTDLGLGELLAAIGRRPDAGVEEYVAARAAVARLLDPRHLGAFRVLAWERAGPPSGAPDVPLPGFGTPRRGSGAATRVEGGSAPGDDAAPAGP